MADKDTRNRTNDPVTAPAADERLPHQSDVNAPPMDREEAASRKQAKESGRGAAKLFGIGLVLLVAIVVVGGFFGGGAWVWAPADEPGDEAPE